ncbi:MAG TPA: hypothetical protein VEZ14_11410, partial [Dehalococcoidia bacterium]|nr:hypothetical protein [Dehalococcoidia bacterium]
MHVSFLRRHAAGIAMAALLALLIAAPRWYLLATQPSSGVRVQVSPWGADHQGSDEAEYQIITQRAFLGDLPVRDPVLSGHAQAPQGNAFWQEAIGTLSRSFSSIFPGIAVAVTLASFVGFLLLYAIAFDAVRSWIAAAFLPIAALVAQVYTQAEGIVQLRHLGVLRAALGVDAVRQFHVWGRFTAPVMLLPLLFGAAYAIPRAVETGSKRWTAAGALCVAVLVYSYLFYWTALALAVAAWLAWLLLRRDLVAARRLALLGGLAALLAAPELISLAHQSLTLSADVSIRVGVDQTAGIDRTVLARVAQRVLLGLPFFWGLRSGRRRDAFYVALFLAPLALVSFKGFVPQPWHYLIGVWIAFAVPALVVGAVGIATRLRPRLPARLTALAVPALAALAAAAVLQMAWLQVRTTRNVDAAFALSADEHAAFSWIDHNVRKGQTVVSTSITTNDLLATLTPASLYVPDGFLSHVSDQQIFDRYLRASAAFGYDEQATFDRIDPARGGADHAPPYEQRFELFMAYYLTNWEVVIAPQRIAARLPALHAEFVSLQASAAPLAAYPADYIYCGPRERYWPAP